MDKVILLLIGDQVIIIIIIWQHYLLFLLADGAAAELGLRADSLLERPVGVDDCLRDEIPNSLARRSRSVSAALEGS